MVRFRRLCAALLTVGALILPAPAAAASAPASACTGPTIRPLPAGTVLSGPWKAPAPPDGATYDLTGVTSTDYPSTSMAYDLGSTTPGHDTCFTGGKVQGKVDPTKTWDYYHDTFNGACVRIVAIGLEQVTKVRCDSEEDGVRPKETGFNANNAALDVEGTYLSTIRDDCIENDFTIGGLLRDNLWESCNTGISERPSDASIAAAGGAWTSPPGETLTLDHMLIGLSPTPHAGQPVGENALFKWSASANHLVLKCSVFKVDSTSLNGARADNIPAGTVVDDSTCPGAPTTIVWLGKGAYPGTLVPGVHVTTDVRVWNSAVATWKTAHGF